MTVAETALLRAAQDAAHLPAPTATETETTIEAATAHRQARLPHRADQVTEPLRVHLSTVARTILPARPRANESSRNGRQGET